MFSLIAENSFDLISLLDLNGNYIYSNRTYSDILGYLPGEMIGRSAFDIVHPDDKERTIKLFYEGLAEKRTEANITIRLLCRNGDYKWVAHSARLIANEHGEPYQILVSAQDITERKQAEDSLRESEEKFRSYVENAPDGIFLADETGSYLFVNDAACAITGYSRKELLKKNLRELVFFEDIPKAEKHFMDVVEKGRSIGESRLITKTGEIRHWIVKAVKLSENRFLGFTSDITKRKHAEEEQEKLREQLLQSRKMESVGRLAGGVAHDFNNMLSVILGHTEMMLDLANSSHPFHDDLKEIQKAAQRSANLTRQLLAFARKQAVSPVVLELNDTVTSMLKMLRSIIGENIELVWKAGTDIWPVKIDPSQIDQILVNLCVNARDAIAGVGRIEIKTGNTMLDRAFCADHPGSIPGDYVLLTVKDDGCGMDKEILEHIFEPFFTTKGVGHGSGLGLATVYGIVNQNDGFIYVHSEPERGSVFEIYLPRHLDQSGRICADEPVLQQMGVLNKSAIQCADVSIASDKETILLVEDEPAVLDMTVAMLKGMEYHVLSAATPREAIRLAGEHVGEIHLLLTDVIMPEMNGLDLSKRLMSAYPNIKRIFISGYTADVITRQGILNADMQFIQKPFSVNDLAAKIRKVLGCD